MHAFEIPELRFSLPAGGAVARRRFVMVGTDSKASQCNATGNAIGVSMNAVETDKGVTAAQQVVEIATGLVIVEAAGTIAAGAKVASDANGKAVAQASDAPVAGIAITAGTAGGVMTVLIK